MRTLSTLSYTLFALATIAQDGTFDASFNTGDEGMARLDGLHWAMNPTAFPGEGVRTMTVQSDGKLLVGGWFPGGVLSIEDPVLRPGIARLNTDGSVDDTFDAGSGFDGPVEVMVVQPDGRILVGGAFLACQGQPRKGIARLNADGSLDATFTVGTGTGGTVFEIVLQGDGRILLGGNFTTFNALPAGRIVRLLANGSYDGSLNTGAGFDARVWAIGVQVDGSIIVGGEFTAYDGFARSKVARISSTGLIDLSYAPPASGTVTDIGIGSGGSAYLVGTFTYLPGSKLYKFTGAGALDPAFTATPDARWVTFLQSTNTVVPREYHVPGLKKLNGTTGAEICGSAHLPRSSCNFLPQDWTISAVGPSGECYRVDPSHMGIQRFTATCAFDDTFRPGTGLGWHSPNMSLTMDEFGQASIGGRVNGSVSTLPSLNGTYGPDLYRLTLNGEFDASFLFELGIEGTVDRVLALSGGRFLFQGKITLTCGPGGSYVMTNALIYDPSTGGIGPLHLPFGACPAQEYGPDVQDVIELNSGKFLYVGQDLCAAPGFPVWDVGRFYSNGDVDGTYISTDFGPTDELPQCVLEAADAKVYVGGNFTTAGGLVRNRIVRLLANGGVDPGFDPLGGFDGRVRRIIENPDGTIVCIGDFTTYRGSPAPHIAKLQPDASMDPSFDPGTGIANTPLCMLRYPDGRILVGGAIPMYDGHVVNGIVCINGDGSIDETFDQGEGFRINNPAVNGGMPGGGTVYDMEMQPNGQVVCMGEFHSYDGNGRNRLARIGSGTSMMVSARVFLEGAYDGSGGMAPLIPRAMLPLSEPYRALGFTHVRGGSESTSEAVMQAQGAGAIIDWVMMELRDAQDPTQVVATRSGLLRADGWIADMDGVSPLRFPGLFMGQFYVAIRHRNHLSIMTDFAVFLGSMSNPIDFTGPNYGTYGTNAQKEVNGVRMLWAGDVDHNGAIKYTGVNNDRDPILVSIGGNVPTNTSTGYKQEDINLDGEVKYTGQNNDRDPILVNIGGTVPTNVRNAQLP